jgi:putative tricarboxylic transport membrane protein
MITALLLGTLYGLVIGLIPAAGATTGLVILFGFMSYFTDPYLGVVFCMATVAASTTGDTYSGVLLGIPGANSSAATMVDGHPLAKRMLLPQLSLHLQSMDYYGEHLRLPYSLGI